MHDEVIGRTRFWNTQTKNRNTHTHGQGKIYMPFRHSMAGTKTVEFLLISIKHAKQLSRTFHRKSIHAENVFTSAK